MLKIDIASIIVLLLQLRNIRNRHKTTFVYFTSFKKNYPGVIDSAYMNKRLGYHVYLYYTHGILQEFGLSSATYMS